jgi:hypothetical protein
MKNGKKKTSLQKVGTKKKKIVAKKIKIANYMNKSKIF